MLNIQIFKQSVPAPHIALIHGLFGDKDNLSSLRRALQEQFNVIMVELPGHGNSPRINKWSFEETVKQLHKTLAHHQCMPDALVGHSLGGKVAMAYGLLNPSPVKAIIAADIAPVVYPPRHQAVFDALKAVPLSEIKTRKDAADILTSRLESAATVQFLLKGLKKSSEEKWYWQFDLNGIFDHYNALSDWPFTSEKYQGDITFIKGELSDYINQQSSQAIAHHFPKAKYKIIGSTGHWLHAEKPLVFNRLCLRVLNSLLP